VNLLRLFAYDDWANRTEVELLREEPNAAALRLLAHIVGAEWLWYSRLRGEPPRDAVWPELSLDDCERSVDLICGFWKEYVSDAPLEKTISYVNSKGEPWTSRVEDVLTHVILHGAYHRGQIATVVRSSGQEPAYTDYIHCARNELI
jgi:uncharacterized damage-inducible protein DinB